MARHPYGSRHHSLFRRHHQGAGLHSRRPHLQRRDRAVEPAQLDSIRRHHQRGALRALPAGVRYRPRPHRALVRSLAALLGKPDMDLFASLALGFSVALDPVNILYCFIGVLLGTLVGVLPGIGPTATIAMLLPITFTLSPATSLIMLAGIYYGAQYGGSTTAILINLPGESSSAVTAID